MDCIPARVGGCDGTRTRNRLQFRVLALNYIDPYQSVHTPEIWVISALHHIPDTSQWHGLQPHNVFFGGTLPIKPHPNSLQFLVISFQLIIFWKRHDRTWTDGLLLRKQMFFPTELHAYEVWIREDKWDSKVGCSTNWVTEARYAPDEDSNLYYCRLTR